MARAHPQFSQQLSRNKPLPPSTGGWNTRDNSGYMQATDCPVLDNIIPRPSFMELREGCQLYASMSDTRRLLPFEGGPGVGNLFSSTATALYNVTSGTPSLSVSGLTSGDWDYVNHGAGNSQYLAMVNGADAYRYWDGTSWSTQATFVYNAGTIATSTFIGITSFASRLMFVPKGELAFYYMKDAGTIFGEVRRFNLASLFVSGGRLMTLARWSIDGGNDMKDRLVCISSNGEVAVFSGTDPADINLWSLDGVYQIAPPLGRRCTCLYGGDLLILTASGIYPLSQALTMGKTDGRAAITDKIAPSFSAAAQLLGAGNSEWQLINFSPRQLLLANVPSALGEQFVMDQQTKGWCRFTGWKTKTFVVWNGQLFMEREGAVYRAFWGRMDDTTEIKGWQRFADSFFGAAALKQIDRLRIYMQLKGYATITLGAFNLRTGRVTSYNFRVGTQAESRWGTALWGRSSWSASEFVFRDWKGIASNPDDLITLVMGISSKGGRVQTSTIEYLYRQGRIQ